MATFDYNKLEELLLSKDYSELSVEQQQWVCQAMQPTDYEAQRKILLNTPTTEHIPLPVGNLGDLQQLHKEHYPPSLSVWSYTFTLWQTALIAVLSGVLVYYILPRQIPIVQTKEIEVHTTDTIVQEQIIYEPKVVYEIKEIKTPTQIDTVYISLPKEAPLDSFFMQSKRTLAQKIDSLPTKGKSMKGRGDLWDLMAKGQ